MTERAVLGGLYDRDWLTTRTIQEDQHPFTRSET